MRLYELAVVCKSYELLTNFDSDYSDFVAGTQGRLDFQSDAHRTLLLRWLNKWGCRQFAKDYHALAADNIRSWAQAYEPMLPAIGRSIRTLSQQDIGKANVAYSALVLLIASKRQAPTGLIDVHIGPTGAAKILFAARPKSLPPWDEPIAAKYNGSYQAYLSHAQQQARELFDEAKQLGLNPNRIAEELGRDESTLAKLIDEYNWVTITRGGQLVSASEILKWASWT